jgi:ABC-type sugar transport system permease subunit
MSENLLSALIFTPLIVAAIASAITWRFTPRPVLYLVASVLVLLGIQALISPVAISVFLVPDTNLSKAAAHEAFVRSVVSGALGVVILGSPLLWWLFRGLRRA